MKTLFSFLLFIVSVVSYADNKNTNVVYSREDNAHYIPLDNNRDLKGGTIFIPHYVGSNISTTMKGAFEYACKLVEEKIPSALPFNISVEFSNLSNTVSSDCLALVEAIPDTSIYYSDYTRIYMKRQIVRFDFTDYIVNDERYLEYIKDGIDARIKFNTRKPFSYAIDPTDMPNTKYDFITVAVQALLKAIGFTCSVYTIGDQLYISGNANSYTRELLSGNPTTNYAIATSNNAHLFDWPIYSTPPYKQGISLCYFTDSPDSETAIMQYGIAPGAYIRKIGRAIDDFFRFSDWGNLISVGYSYNRTEDAHTSEVISFSPFTQSTSGTPRTYNNTLSLNDTSDNYYTSKSEFSDNGTYVLLKDGSWREYNNLSQLTDNENYARTADGYLRLKNVWSELIWGRENKRVTYQLYDYIPQKPELAMNSYEIVPYTTAAANMRRSQRSVSEDAVFCDIEIGFKNIEGTTAILVEQTDLDYPYPYSYYITDLTSGKFTAYMTLNYPSVFKLTYINENGSTTGERHLIDLYDELGIQRSYITTDITNEAIEYCLHDSNSQSIQYTITDIRNGKILMRGHLSEQNGSIDISSLSKGTFIFKAYNASKELGEKKWKR